MKKEWLREEDEDEREGKGSCDNAPNTGKTTTIVTTHPKQTPTSNPSHPNPHLYKNPYFSLFNPAGQSASRDGKN